MKQSLSCPLVSIVLTTNNMASFLNRSIGSVLKQTFKDWEFIVVDDASTDDTKKVVSAYADERIIYIKHKSNKGPAVGRNTGLQIARGEYIAFLDGDDEWCCKEKLSSQVKILSESSPDVCCVYSLTCQYKNGSELLIPGNTLKKREGNLFRSFLRCKYLMHLSSVLIRKSALDEVGYFDGYFPATAELDVWIRLAKKFSFRYIDKCQVFSYYTPGSMSTNRFMRALAMFRIWRKHRRDIAWDIRASFIFLFWINRYFLSGILLKIGLKK